MEARRSAAHLAVAFSVVVLAAATACGSSDSGGGTGQRAASTTRAASTQTKRFASAVYPYRIVLAEGWFAKYGQNAWDATSELSSSSPAFDYYRDGTREIFVGAAALPEQPSLEQWRDTVIAATPASCTNDGSFEQSSLDNERALVWTETCGGSEALIKLAALHQGDGYVVGLLSPARRNKAAERQLFDSTRRSFHFTERRLPPAIGALIRQYQAGALRPHIREHPHVRFT
jgi:hypothetical protein